MAWEREMEREEKGERNWEDKGGVNGGEENGRWSETGGETMRGSK